MRYAGRYMWVISRSFLVACWFAWFYPFLFRAPHRQRRPSITIASPTRAGLLLEGAGIFAAFILHRPAHDDPGLLQQLLAAAIGALSAVMAWQAVAHLGRQFRINAGLYEDHQLVRTGPYAIVRHPIYSSLLGMLVCTILMLTRWQWAPVSLALYIAGTEIRVRAEDALLAGRFGDEFERYRRAVKAYIPFVR
ncbi:MAG TPA: isoprenylcysteine carboxylmethyltransferase family protein [Bryobacteraceae bacterium]|jgi:protein-S-isoprenylcysteine O-methyltransferase Ste14|nr:isoprenylcysteine carboxylmethyltransferase family protein [Bryobacteraceae bacterium]